MEVDILYDLDTDSLVSNVVKIEADDSICGSCSRFNIEPYSYSECGHTVCKQCKSSILSHNFICYECNHVTSILYDKIDYHLKLGGRTLFTSEHKYVICTHCTSHIVVREANLLKKCIVCDVKNENMYFNRPLRNLLLKQTVKCNSSEECRDIISLENYFTHIKKCDFNKVVCELCNKKYILRDKELHVNRDCTVVCDKCQNPVLCKDSAKHINICKINCEHCRMPVLYEGMKFHIDNFCEYAPKDCHWCLQKISYDKFNLHQNTCQMKPITCTRCYWVVNQEQFLNHSTKTCPELMLECLHNCGQIIANKYRYTHQDICPRVFVYCNNKDKSYRLCDVSYERGMMTEHNNICPNMQIPCMHCEKQFCRGEMARHVEKCNRKTVSCYYCKIEIREGQLQDHLNTMCEKKKIQCKWCNQTVGKKDIGYHLKYLCVYSNSRKIKCHLCQNLIFKDNYKQHIDSMHQNTQKKAIK